MKAKMEVRKRKRGQKNSKKNLAKEEISKITHVPQAHFPGPIGGTGWYPGLDGEYIEREYGRIYP